MVTAVWPAQGTTLGISINNNNTYSLINNITSITDAGGGTVTQARTTSLASTVHTYRPTIPDPGEINFSVWFDPTDAVHREVRNLKDSPNQAGNQYEVIFNTGNTNSNVLLVANVSNLDGLNAPDVEENLQADFTLKPTGAPVWTAS